MLTLLKIHFSVVLVLIFCPKTNAQWDNFPLPCRPYIVDLQTHNGHIYATSSNGNTFESADQGQTWAWRSQLAGGQGLVINPQNWNLYTLRKQTDGEVWIDVQFNNGSFGGTDIPAPFAETYYNSRLNLSGDTIFLSNGLNLQFNTTQTGWVPLPVPADFYFHESVVRGQHVWADNYSYLLHSPDLGGSWDTLGYDPQNNLGLAAAGDTILTTFFDSVQQQRVFRRTIDGGITWDFAPNPLNIGNLKSGRPFFGSDPAGAAWFSWNGLTDWQKIDSEFNASGIRFLGGNMFLGQAAGVEIVKNSQRQWAEFGTGIRGEMSGALVSVRTADDWLLFGGQYGQGLYKRTTAAGANWSHNSEPYFADRTVKIGNQLLGCGAKGTYRAPLGGADFQWSLLNSQTGYLLEMNGKPYRAAADGSLHRSDDGGQTWVQTGTVPGTFFDGSLDEAGGRLFFKNNNDILVSTNEGQTWNVQYSFPPNINLSGNSRMYSAGNALFVSYTQEQKIFRSVDNGATFNALPSVPQSPQQGFFRLRSYGGQLFLFILDGKLYRSADLGLSWLTVKPPYADFDFDPSIANHAMTVEGSKIVLFDPAQGAAWVADIAQTAPSPCDNVFLNLPEESCDTYLNMVAPVGFQHTWLKDGLIIFQGNNYINSYPDGYGQNGSTYTLIVTDPVSGCSVSDETTIKRPVAEVGYAPVMACDEAFQVLDLTGCSQGPGITYSIYGIFFSTGENYSYFNSFDIAGNPSNPNPPIINQPGYFILQVNDPKVGCYLFDTIDIQRNIPDPITALYTTFTSCGQNDGTATVQIATDPAKTDISWSNGANGSLVSNLAPGWYSVTVTEDFCRESRNFQIHEDTACLVRIRGTIWDDRVTADCNPNDASGVKEIMLHLLPDDVYTFSDKYGNYEFAKQPGSYTVEFSDPVRYDLLCPSSGEIAVNLPSFGVTSYGNDFFGKAKPVQNLTISVSPGGAVAGFPQKFSVWVCNLGDQYVPDVQVVFTHDAVLVSPNSNYNFDYDAAAHTMTWKTGLYPGQCTQIDFQLQVPASTPLGTLLYFSADVLPNSGDFTPADNQQTGVIQVRGSFDPNEKTVSPGEFQYGGEILEKDSVLRYTIHFQNVGNYPATTVEIRDTLDENLNVTSIQSGATSHPYQFQMRFEGHNVLVFRFDNINLPDSASSQEMSRGFVSFSIKRKPGLPLGTLIYNRAGIYFDFNSPIITNRVESIISAPLNVRPALRPNYVVSLFPNPNSGQFNVVLPAPASQEMSIRITDLAGRLVQEQKTELGNAYQTVRAGELPNGLYFLQVVSEGKVLAVEKFVKH